MTVFEFLNFIMLSMTTLVMPVFLIVVGAITLLLLIDLVKEYKRKSSH